MTIIDDFLADTREHMSKSVEATRGKFGSVRTGRASPALLDRITVDYYGTQTPLKQLATVSAPEARLLTVQPYDKNSVKAIERAILESDIGLTPNNDGQIIRLQIPELTEERRRQLVRVVRGLAEEGKVAVRNIRRDTMHDLRELRDAGEAGSDDEHRAEEALQKLTDEKDSELIEQMEWAESHTAPNERITLFVAFNYGGRAEIVDAARSFTGTTEDEFRQHLYAPEMHDPDLVIRTSGEQRLSNYLMWQSAYSELVFTEVLWPDFSREDLEFALAEFDARKRRFGGR